MEEDQRKKVIDWIIGGLVSIVLINLGIQEMIDPQKYAGVITIVLAFILLYFVFYIYQMKTNQKDIHKLKAEIGEVKKDMENEQELLNTLRDIIILKGVKGIK
ncbi:MAG: hypothetical protein PHH00_00040 [Candidatus Nanoarchaeia archaeon]|nr:hypothetical protein [Candidatus Nanoarchaeia archaeon]